jgi:ABC-2 type transport system ATP-binding protein
MLTGLGRRPVRVRSSHTGDLLARLQERGFAVERVDAQELQVADVTAEQVGELAHSWNIPVHRIAEVEQSLEDAYLKLTAGSVQFHGGTGINP